MRKIYICFFIYFFLCTGSFAQTVVVAGADATTVAGNPYTTLKAAFDNINLVSQAGNIIVITITGTTTETSSAILNQSVGPWTSMSIIPVGAASVTGNVPDLIDLRGADNIIIDGLNAAGNSLTFTNNSVGLASTFQFTGDASNNTITRCSILGSGTAFGVIFFGDGTLTGNDNNSITQCDISAAGSGLPVNAILSIGLSTVADNSNNTISNNTISDYYNTLDYSAGIILAANNSAWTINNNKLYQTATRTYPSFNTHYGIRILAGDAYSIENNIIGFANAAGTGTTNMIGLSSGSLGGTFPSSFTTGGTPVQLTYIAISCAFTTGGVVSSIQNNTIAGIALYTNSAASTTFGVLCGIAVTSGNANIGTVTGNTIGSASTASSIYMASASVSAIVAGIYCTTTNTIAIQNNTIGGIDVSGTSATTAAGFKGIEVAGAGTYTVTSNNIGNATANNIRTGYLLTGGNLSNTATTPTAASGTSSVRGIVSTATGSTLNITFNIISGLQVSGTATVFTGISNTGNVTTTININSNQIGNSAAGAVTFIAATSGAITGISNAGAAATTTINISDNSMQGISCVSSGTVTGIENGTLADSDIAININNNQLGTATGNFITYSSATGNVLRGVLNAGGAALCVVTIQNNSIRGIVHTLAASASHTYISNTAGGIASVNILGNTFINLNVNTSGNVFFISRSGAMLSGASATISNNSIAGTFSKPSGLANDVYMYSCSSVASAAGSTVTISNNNFSNITIASTGGLYGILDTEGIIGAGGPAKNISGNIFNNISLGPTGNFGAILTNYGSDIIITSNTVSNVSGNGDIVGIFMVATFLTASYTVTSNSISSFSSTGGTIRGIYGSTLTSTTSAVNSNTISGLSSGGASVIVAGINFTNGGTINIYDNVINSLGGSGTTSPVCFGIWIINGVNINIYRNRIHTLFESGATVITSPAVHGISFSNISGTATIYNNFISNLNAANANFTDAIRGININGTTAGTTYNLYYNSVYLNAVSSGTNFGTSGIFHTTSATATTARLNLIDNILVNTSTANGTGVAAAYRRSDATLDNYAATSDYNLFYAGTPSANRLIYYDGTNSDQALAAYQTRVSTRDVNSISIMPVFTSATDLHLTPANCALDNSGTPVAGLTSDIDVDTRSVTVPDIGADEFDAYNTAALAGVVSTAVCSNKAVVNTGTMYTDASCNLIASVLPSGGDPVTGLINTCVTRDAAQLYFNGEPYVQRHYDLEPVTSNQTTTSATITMYFTDAEFELYNTTNPAWPRLPTVATGGMGSAFIGNVKVTQFHGTPTGGLPTSTPGNYTGTSVVFNAPVLTLNGSIWSLTISIAGFSGFYVHTNNFNAPLPITVNYLTGRKQGSNHLLNWKVTCNSTPRVTITIERSLDSRNFTGINTITADAARCNQPFDYTDANPLKGMNYYRLKIVDADGKVTYSTTVALLNAVKGFDMVSIAPNPVVNNNFKLNVASAQAGKMEMDIFDMQGRLVNRQTISLIAGFNSQPVRVDKLSAGTYTIRCTVADEQFRIIRFVKQ